MLHGRWTDRNRHALESLIEKRHVIPPIAVFDWDNTCIQGDIADAVFHHLSADMAFKFDAPGFDDWLFEAGCADRIVSALSSYRANPTSERRLELRMAFEQTRNSLQRGLDVASACAWDVGAFVGWTTDQVRSYTRRVILGELGRPLGVETLELGGERLEFKIGLRLRAEMQELMESLQGSGWKVWVLSASCQWEIEEFAAMYGLPPQQVVGMRRVIARDRITQEVEPPVSYSDGKLDAYRLYIDKIGAPRFVAGDSVGDWKLLESATEMRLLIEPSPSPLREFAVWRHEEGEAWLLQGFD